MRVRTISAQASHSPWCHRQHVGLHRLLQIMSPTNDHGISLRLPPTCAYQQVMAGETQ